MKMSQPRIARPAPASGFTILELMITVAVLAILVGIAVPSFNEMIRQNRLATQTNDLLTATAVARSEAVKRGSRVTLCPANADGSDCSGTAQWSAGWLVIADDGPNVGRLDPPGEMVLQRWPAATAQGMSVVSAQNLTSISYRGSGSTDLGAAGATFAINNDPCKNPSGQRTVEVTTAGRARVTRGNCSG